LFDFSNRGSNSLGQGCVLFSGLRTLSENADAKILYEAVSSCPW
jgi:hypothetical protein